MDDQRPSMRWLQSGWYQCQALRYCYSIAKSLIPPTINGWIDLTKGEPTRVLSSVANHPRLAAQRDDLFRRTGRKPSPLDLDPQHAAMEFEQPIA
jgi:hypothetical protein